MTLRTIDSLGSLSGKRVLVRCDLNVPLNDGVITDDGRIRASIPTLNELIHAGARVVVLSHLGRPGGSPNAKYSLAPVAQRLSELLGQPVTFASDTVGAAAAEATDTLGNGDVAMLENLRFNAGETAKDEKQRTKFARKLAAFGVVHRKHASVFELATLLPSAAGRLIATELEVLDRLTGSPVTPYTVVLGGSKVSDKLGVINHLLPRVTSLLIGGGMLFTFLAAQGYDVGSSLLEADQLDAVRGYLAEAERLGVRIVLPSDVVVASRFAEDAEHVVRPATSI